MAEHSFSKELPALVIMCGIGIVGFVVSLGWGKTAGRTMDSGTVRFLAYMWAGIAAFGMVMAFIM